MATYPKPDIEMLKVATVTSPGLLPEVQVTLVVVAAVAVQLTPSISIVYLVMSETKPVPVNVTEVPPLTVPNLGSSDFRRGVNVA